MNRAECEGRIHRLSEELEKLDCEKPGSKQRGWKAQELMEARQELAKMNEPSDEVKF